MTGWRLGYSVWPNVLLEYANRLCVNNHSCVNTASQYAGIAALRGPQNVVDEMLLEDKKFKNSPNIMIPQKIEKTNAEYSKGATKVQYYIFECYKIHHHVLAILLR